MKKTILFIGERGDGSVPVVPDFRETPKKSTYRFENDVCKENTEGSFLEVPITSFHRPLFL